MARPHGGWGWPALVGTIVALCLFPVIALLALAHGSSLDVWRHLATTVLPRAIGDTLLLMLGVGTASLVVGTVTAWVVTMYRFPGRDVLAWLLLMPLAVPTYIVAYCYGALLDYAGPVQGAVRALIGVSLARDYWFPEIRSLGGAIFVLSAVLYPYVYLAARSSFVQQSITSIEAARTLGRNLHETFLTIALPMARPALVAGVALALMECMNDVGANEYLGVRTLTVTAYATWLQRSSLAGAIQIATLMLFVVLVLFAIERMTRGRRAYGDPDARFRPPPGLPLTGWRAAVAIALCALPVLIGCVVPILVLITNAPNYVDELASSGFWRAAGSSLGLASLAAVLTSVLGLTLAYAARVAPGAVTRAGGQMVRYGYAVPGTVLAIGILVPLAAFDNWLDGLLRAGLGISTGLLLSGSLAAVLLAFIIRFLAISIGVAEAGLGRISMSLDAAARTLGETAARTFLRVHAPLLRPVIAMTLMLVFVEAMKELPATLLLRPFGFETLASRVYGFAALEQFEQATFGALLIVLVGLIPVFLLERIIRGGPEHGPSQRGI